MHSQSRKFKNNHIEFIIDNNEFTIVNKVDYEEGYVRSKTFCQIYSNGKIAFDSFNFFKLNSKELPVYDFSLKESTIDLEKGLCKIKIILNGLSNLDANNFNFSTRIYSNLLVESDDSKTEITFTSSLNHLNLFKIYISPNNKNGTLDDIISYSSYSSILFYTLIDIPNLKTSNNYLEFTIDNFNVCDLYTHKIVNEYVKIENDTLYWRDEILKEVF